MTGTTAVVLTNPYEVIVAAAQKHRVKATATFIIVLNNSGPQALYRGALPMGMRNGGFFSMIAITPALDEKSLPLSLVPARCMRLQRCSYQPSCRQRSTTVFLSSPNLWRSCGRATRRKGSIPQDCKQQMPRTLSMAWQLLKRV